MISCAGKNSNERRRSEDINQLHLIKEAKRCVLLEDYAKATILYKQAFKVNVKTYANYCFTAAQVSAVCNEFEGFIFFARKGFQSGLNYFDYERDSLLTDYHNANKLEPKLKELFKNDSLIYNQTVNHQSKNEVDELSKLDNKWKIFYNDSLSKVDPQNKENYIKIYDSIVSEIVEKSLMPLIEK